MLLRFHSATAMFLGQAFITDYMGTKSCDCRNVLVSGISGLNL